MLDRMRERFRPRRIRVTVLGMVGDRVVRADETLTLRGALTVQGALQAAGRRTGVDLVGVLQAGAEPTLMLNGERLTLPDDLVRPVPDGAHVSWLMPMAGG